jgi:MFS transporter, DHA2 family, multidrug resistance protein
MSESISTYEPATREALNALGGPSNPAYAQLDHVLTSQAYMLSTVDYFTLLGWAFMGLIVIVWLAKPPFAAKAGPAASGH